MLSKEQNRILTEVGPGTPMGNLLRRYWMPIAAVSQLDENPVRPVRLMGEDLVLYRDRSGSYGLIDRHCAHRRADLSYGWVEDCGLRCHYHGWLWDRTGRCLAQPFEEAAHPEARFKDRVQLTAYKVEAKAGLVWAYLGPEPAPLVPTWEPFTWPNGFVQIVFAEIPCNWLQCQENSIDPVHFEWLHGHWTRALRGEGPTPPAHLKVGFDEFEYGFIYRRVLEGQSEQDELWTVGRTCLWPNCLFTGGHFEWRVPIDDATTLSVGWFFDRVPNEREPFRQGAIPAWSSSIKNPATGRWITSHVMNQDFVAWTGQGVIADRTQEHLGESDRGVIMIRKRLLDDTEVVARGADPKGLIRDPARNECVTLPIIARDHFVKGYPQADIDKRPGGTRGLAIGREFPFQTGQPAEVRAAFRRAMGLDPA
ncbi:MAG TPA: aromatic ring-hydroxylating dioxygenase subunit alpha [Candidatus Methylomirabilis sp.]|nr:aromatic ring-hydroxylating dioxygenase subunit alpha [Candidatus Methylomirabilis sp.]